jgi:hypothetical protein
MKALSFAILTFALLVANGALADGVNQRQGAAPATKAKVNRQLAGAYAQGGVKDNTTVKSGDSAAATLEIGTGNSTGRGGSSAPREQTIVTRDNTVICLRCRGGH